MANRVHLETYKFVPLDEQKSETFGYVIYDDYEYQVGMYLEEEEIKDTDIKKLLTTVYNNISLESEIFEVIATKGCLVNSTFYDSDELEPIIKEILEENKETDVNK